MSIVSRLIITWFTYNTDSFYVHRVMRRLPCSFQILNKTQDDIYKGVHSTAIKKTVGYYRQCMDEQAINNISIAPALKVY